MSNPIDRIVDRIQKLLKLAAANTNPEEAGTAAALAQELLFKHKLNIAEIEAAGGAEDADPLGTIDVNTPGSKWRSHLVHGIAYAFYCRGLTMHNKTVQVIGKTSDIQTVNYMAAYLINEIERLARETCPGMGVAYANSFRVGAACAIRERLAVNRKAQEEALKNAGTTALVVQKDQKALNQYFKTLHPRTTTNPGPRATAHSAFEAGQEAGRNVDLGGGHRALGSQARRLTA